MLTLAKEVVQYCLTMFSALATNHTYGIAVTVDGINTTTTVAIIMMWELNVTDTSSIQRPVSLDKKDTGLEILIDFLVFV